MKTDLQGRVRNTRLAASHGLLPLFEAIVNSIDAISERGTSNGKITVTIHRSQEELDKDAHGNRILQISDFSVQDNGTGFTDRNLESFETLDTQVKADMGGKGVGRLIWLKAFESAHIESRYIEGDEVRKRQFDFVLNRDGVSNIEEETLSHLDPKRTEPETTVRLVGFVDRYRAASPKSADVIARRIVEHCMEYFVLDDAPEMWLEDPEEDEADIDLNELFEDEYKYASQRRDFDVEGHPLSIQDVLLRADADVEHRVGLCAHNRVVREIHVERKIPHLGGRLYLDGEPVVYSGFVSGELLDEKVEPTRTGFALDRRGELSLQGTVAWEDLRDAVVEQVGSYVRPITEEARERSLEKTERYVSTEAPRYRPTLRYRRDEVAEIPADATDTEREKRLHGIYTEMKHKLFEEAQTELDREDGANGAGDIEKLQARHEELFEQLQEVTKSELAEYVLHRRVILEFFRKRLNLQESGDYSYESDLHGIFFPQHTTSDEIDYDEHNLWILDERLAYHQYLASDKRFDSHEGPYDVDSEDRPDLVVYNNAMAFSDEDHDISSVVIVEFKRPERTEYTEDENPITQVKQYVRQIREGKAKDANGRTIRVPENTPFYCYIVATLTPELETLADFNDFKTLPDGEGYFRYHSQWRAYIQLISYEKVWKDAKRRNQVFFDKLGLPNIRRNGKGASPAG